MLALQGPRKLPVSRPWLEMRAPGWGSGIAEPRGQNLGPCPPVLGYESFSGHRGTETYSAWHRPRYPFTSPLVHASIYPAVPQVSANCPLTPGMGLAAVRFPVTVTHGDQLFCLASHSHTC